MSTKSGNLKGTFRKLLNDAAANINAAVHTLGTRTEGEEFKRLERINAELKSEISELRAEIELLKQQNAKRKWESGSSRYVSPPAPLPETGIAASSPRQ